MAGIIKRKFRDLKNRKQDISLCDVFLLPRLEDTPGASIKTSRYSMKRFLYQRTASAVETWAKLRAEKIELLRGQIFHIISHYAKILPTFLDANEQKSAIAVQMQLLQYKKHIYQ